MQVRSFRRLGPVAVAATLLLAGPAARAGPCDAREVVDLVAAHYRRQSPHLEMVADSAVEIRTLPGRVLCAVGVRVGFADPEAGRDAVLRLVEPRYYEVEPVGLGARVDFGGR